MEVAGACRNASRTRSRACCSVGAPVEADSEIASASENVWAAVSEADDRVCSAIVNGDALSVDERRGREDDGSRRGYVRPARWVAMKSRYQVKLSFGTRSSVSKSTYTIPKRRE